MLDCLDLQCGDNCMPSIEYVSKFNDVDANPKWLSNVVEYILCQVQFPEDVTIVSKDPLINKNMSEAMKILKHGFKQLDIEDVDCVNKECEKKSLHMDRWGSNIFSD